MSHRRTDSASSVTTDVSTQSCDEVEKMLTRSRSTISEASVPEPAPGVPYNGLSYVASLVYLATKGLSMLYRINSSYRLLPAPSNTPPGERIDCHRLLEAMLRYTRSASSKDSDDSERYVAAAIASCQGELDQYIRLANTWFGLFLWPFRHNENCALPDFSEAATPTVEATTSHAGLTTINERSSKMKEDVIIRDDYKCVVTGYLDIKKYGYLDNSIDLQCAHILKRAVSTRAARTDHESASLFDILVNLFPRAASRLRDLGDMFDAPVNGIMLGMQTHSSFDQFRFCLIPWPRDNPEPHTYKVKLLMGKLHDIEESIIKFEDHSHKHREPLPPPEHNYHLRSGQKQPATPLGVALPDPQFIAIHAAVAQIMHMSGAAGFIDYILRRWGDEFPKLKIPKADELEDLNYLASAFAAADLTSGMANVALH